MATHSLASQLTMMELAKREHNDALMEIINVLSQVNDIILDASWIECNNGTSFKGVRVATEPEGSERDYNDGVAKEAATTDPFEEPTCMLDGIMKSDVALLRHSPSAKQARMQDLQIYLRGMSKTFAKRMLYGDKGTDSKQINGIMFRKDYNKLASPYVYDNAGGAIPSVKANKTIIMIVGWGPKKIQLTYPRNDAPGNSQITDATVQGLGIKTKDYGEKIVAGITAGTEFPAWVTWLECHFGLVIHDPRYIRVIANISTTAIDNIDDFGFNEDYMIDMVNDMPDLDGAVIYVPRHVRGQMWKRVKDSGNRNFEGDKDPFGRPMVKFLEIPIRLVDQISVIGSKIT